MGKKKKRLILQIGKENVYMYVATGEKNFLLNHEKGIQIQSRSMVIDSRHFFRCSTKELYLKYFANTKTEGRKCLLHNIFWYSKKPAI